MIEFLFHIFDKMLSRFDYFIGGAIFLFILFSFLHLLVNGFITFIKTVLEYVAIIIKGWPIKNEQSCDKEI